jgi:hypothetical protein
MLTTFMSQLVFKDSGTTGFKFFAHALFSSVQHIRHRFGGIGAKAFFINKIRDCSQPAWMADLYTIIKYDFNYIFRGKVYHIRIKYIDSISW